jgi:L-iditol 2-dehydrogenase
MRAATLEAAGVITVGTVPDPMPASDEVLVRVAACGVCGTDRSIFRDEYPVSHPLVMGHEYAGTIVGVGSAVVGLSLGDRVAVDPNVVDDTCFFCRHGVNHLCSGLSPLGVVRSGGFAELSAVPARYTYVLPDSVSLEAGSQVEPIACCVHGIDRAGIVSGDVVAVMGCGPIGCMLIQLARGQGASLLVAIDPNPARRELAKTAGADYSCAPEAATELLARLRPAVGPDVVIEASGSSSAAEAAIALVRRGGTVLLFAVYPEDARISISPFRINEDELRVVGTLNNPHTHQRAIDLLAAGRLDVSQLITDEITLDELGSAMDPANFPRAGKIIVRPASDATSHQRMDQRDKGEIS